jgi:hypothetical protein
MLDDVMPGFVVSKILVGEFEIFGAMRNYG